jgi:cleavage stimulation factor subunit 2
MSTTDKHDVFVGNLAFDVTDEELRAVFSTVGTVNAVRVVNDRDTGRPKGFAFVEFDDSATALSAIRNLDGQEMNGRKLRVSYSNNSNLKDIARSTGEDVKIASSKIANCTSHLALHEAYDILDGMKKLVDEDRGHRAREILEANPQLITALNEIMTRLGLPSAAPK